MTCSSVFKLCPSNNDQQPWYKSSMFHAVSRHFQDVASVCLTVLPVLHASLFRAQFGENELLPRDTHLFGIILYDFHDNTKLSPSVRPSQQQSDVGAVVGPKIRQMQRSESRTMRTKLANQPEKVSKASAPRQLWWNGLPCCSRALLVMAMLQATLGCCLILTASAWVSG